MNRHGHWDSLRRRYLKAAYELGELSDRNGVPPDVIVESLGLDEEGGDSVLESLVEAGLVVWPAKGQLMLTELGLKEAKELRHTPEPARLRSSAGLLGASMARAG